MWQLPPLTPEEILAYLRKSQSDDPLLTVEETLSKHEERINAWIERSLPGQGPIPEENRYREVVSGETIDSRPRFLELLRRIESPKIKAVICVEPERLSRGSLKEIGRIVELFRYSNTIIITMQDTYDLRDDRDRELFERALMRGNDYLEYYKRIQRNGRLLSVQRGNYLGNVPPYGFKKTHYKEGKTDCFSLEPIPEEAAIVRQIFQWYADGLGSHTIAKKLNAMGVPAAKGGRWSPESLKRLRCNQHYIGNVVWNQRQEVKTVEDGEIIVSRPVNKDCLVFPGKHDPIVDRELWDAVQEIRGKIPPVPKKAKCVNPFAGIVWCQCGRTMTKRVYKNKGEERSPSRLLCVDQANCHTPSCTVAEMTAEVVKILREAIADFELLIERDNSDSTAFHRQLVEQLERRLEELNKQELNQWDKYTREGMPKHIFDTLNEKVLHEKEEVQQALCTARDSVPEPVDYEAKIQTFHQALELLQDPDAPALQQNLLLKQCIERIEYNRKPKGSKNRRYGTPEPLELDVYLTV